MTKSDECDVENEVLKFFNLPLFFGCVKKFVATEVFALQTTRQAEVICFCGNRHHILTLKFLI